MKVKELIEQLSKLDQERDIWIGYDYPYDVQEPYFVEFERRHLGKYHPNEDRLKFGDYIHFAE